MILICFNVNLSNAGFSIFEYCSPSETNYLIAPQRL